MAEKKDGDIDYTQFSLSELKDVKEHIDAHSYPKNYANLRDAILLAEEAVLKEVARPHIIDSPEARETYKLRVSDQIDHAWPVLLVLFGYPLAVYFVYSKYGSDSLHSSGVIMGVGLLLALIPLVLLHYRYLKINADMTISFDAQRQSIRIGSRHGAILLPVAEVDRITSVKQSGFAKGGFSVFPWQFYSFFEIKTFDERLYVVSSMLVPTEGCERIFGGFDSREEVFLWPPNQIT